MASLLRTSAAGALGCLSVLAMLHASCSSDPSSSAEPTDSGAADAREDRAQGDSTIDAFVPDSAPTKKRVFVTSKSYSGALNGPTGADAICGGAAGYAGLAGSWKAWISDTTVDAIDRIADVGPWYLVDRTTLVFSNKAAIVALPLHAIDVDETGARVAADAGISASLVWTGTDETGHRSTRTISANLCLGWSNGSFSQSGEVGTLSKTDRDWTGGYLEECRTTHRLYCFEQ